MLHILKALLTLIKLKSNRTGAAQSVLGSVRARHNDIQQIERTLIELNQLFQDLAEAVVLQEAPIQQTEVQTTNVLQDTEQGNVQLDKGIKSAGRARKLRKWCFFIIVLIGKCKHGFSDVHILMFSSSLHTCTRSRTGLRVKVSFLKPFLPMFLLTDTKKMIELETTTTMEIELLQHESFELYSGGQCGGLG